MSDMSVVNALRSPARLIVVEAPAGCGKTFQGAEYAREIAGKIGDGRVLILAHTHAACDVFASRTRGKEARVNIRTIDSLISEIAAVYHLSLGLPADTGAWALSQKDGYAELATKVAGLLNSSPMIARSLVKRYPIVICDEHQDASADQHTIAMAFHMGGALVRIFGDPVQRIYGSKKKVAIEADNQRWENLKQEADAFEELDVPHRWLDGSGALGQWILTARTTLRSGRSVDLRGTLPTGVSVIIAENQARNRRGGYSLSKNDAKQIYAFVKATDSILVLATYNETVDALRAFFGRRLPIWEGHMRDNLAILIDAIQQAKGGTASIAQAVVTFLNSVAKGFTPSIYGKILCDEVCAGCITKRSGKPATLQALGRIILEQPNHKGVSKMLHRLFELTSTDPAFKAVKIDYYREFWDAVRIGRFDKADEGVAEISRQRCYTRTSPPAKAISTVHKAKGLECNDVLIVPCDASHFGDSPSARCRLYVAMSRAKRSLTFVVSRQNQSPLVNL
ncbi:MAG: UvrD-helicase domain-containing protein [Syntrophales bacterium]